MSALHIDSVEEPLASDPELAWHAARLVARGETMGFVRMDGQYDMLTQDLVLRAVQGLADAGVLRLGGLLSASPKMSVRDWKSLVTTALAASEASPMPECEWPEVVRVLGEDEVAGLVGVSVSSVRRYAGGSRATPHDVAGRLHLLALVLSDLAGIYNDYGMRRWFSRRRTQLDGRAPRELLSGAWDPDGDAALRVRALAELVTSVPGT